MYFHDYRYVDFVHYVSRFTSIGFSGSGKLEVRTQTSALAGSASELLCVLKEHKERMCEPESLTDNGWGREGRNKRERHQKTISDFHSLK